MKNLHMISVTEAQENLKIFAKGSPYAYAMQQILEVCAL